MVTFRDTVQVKLVRYTTSFSHSSSSQASKLWYTPHELKNMVREHTALCQGLEEITENECVSFLGLETNTFRMKRRQRMESARLAVLTDQATTSLWDVDHGPTTYEICSRESKLLALNRGRELSLALILEDAKVLNCIDHDGFAIHGTAFASSHILMQPISWYQEDSALITIPRPIPFAGQAN